MGAATAEVNMRAFDIDLFMRYCAGPGGAGGFSRLVVLSPIDATPIRHLEKLIVYNFFRRVMFPDIEPICSLSSKTVEKRDGRSRKERNELNECETH
jgi:hypothetical protein